MGPPRSGPVVERGGEVRERTLAPGEPPEIWYSSMMLEMIDTPQRVLRQTLGRRASSRPPELRDPPELSGGLPVLGHTVEFIRSTIELLFRAQRELGEVASFQVAHRRMVALFGPEAHQAVFRAPDSQLSPSEAYKIMVPVFGKDVVYDAPPSKMNEQLKMLLPALQDRRMRSYGEHILREVEQSIAGWGDEGEVDLVDYCRVLTNFTSSHCLLGPEFREEMTDEFARVYHDLERGITPLAYINAHLPLPSFRKRDKARVRLVEMITEIIEQRRHSGREGEDFLQTLMDVTYKSGAPLTEHEITGMLLAAMFAGHHTSSVTTAWTMLELLQNQDYLKVVLAQLEDVYGEHGQVTYDSLREISRTERAVKEALRLHPPLFMLMRGAMEDFEFKGHHIPAGSYVVVSPTVAHRMPEQFADPDRFDPERYGPGREEDKVPFAYIPFGGGRHKCMGNAFALLQVKAILAVLLRRYEFELAGDPIGANFQGLVVGPTEPCRLRYRRRQRAALAQVRAEVASQLEEAEIPERLEPPAHFHLEVDRDLCQGHSVCIGEAPRVFSLDVSNKVQLLQAEPSAGAYARVKTAAKYCPTGAIKVVERDA